MNELQIGQTIEFIKLLENIEVKELKKKIKGRLARFLIGVLGDYKTIDGDLFGLRIMGKSEYRIYVFKIKEKSFLILWGGSKKTQTKDINTAKKLLEKYLE